MRKKNELREKLGYFENYIEPCQAPDTSTVKIILSIVGLAACIALGASYYGWLFN